MGWPVRLIEASWIGARSLSMKALVLRTDAEPHLLIPHCKLIVEAGLWLCMPFS